MHVNCRARALRSPAVAKQAGAPQRILSVDIGGSKVKFLASGETEPRRIPSGPRLEPGKMVERIRAMTRDWSYEAVAIGYCGLVGGSGPLAEPENLGSGWVGFDFAAAFGCPVRILNDAAMQALGSYDGGRMLFLGLGTGLGSVLIIEKTLVPLELGELRQKGDQTLSARVGRSALKAIGKKAWRRRVLKMVPPLQRAFLADYVVLGGGNAKVLKEPLPPGVRLGHNLTAFRGGFRLWGIDDAPTHVDGHKTRRGAMQGEWRLL